MTRNLLLLAAAAMAPLAAGVLPAPRTKAICCPEVVRRTTTQPVVFVSGGSIHVERALGDVIVEAWDRTDVELTVEKSTKRRFRPASWEKGAALLESARVRTVLAEAGRLRVITTAADGVRIRYLLRVPRQSHIRIDQAHGETEVTGVIGSIEIRQADETISPDCDEIPLTSSNS